MDNTMSFSTVKEFENEIAKFYGAPYAVAVDCCTHAIELCLRYTDADYITIPTRTYISIPFLAAKLGLVWKWQEDAWEDFYYLGNTNIIDAAVLWRENSFIPGSFMCLSFQFQKHLSLGRGGMILTDNKAAAQELKRMSYDGREPEKPWREQNISSMGYHYYMTPETAQKGLASLEEAKSRDSKQWAWEDWPDLRNMEVFKNG
jgi:dTDP-4-amino-4,6-dideoxygalactose transaminase